MHQGDSGVFLKQMERDFVAKTLKITRGEADLVKYRDTQFNGKLFDFKNLTIEIDRDEAS